jgi:hypothetical protein
MLAVAATIIFNVLAAQGYINGVTPSDISDRYPTALTPAGYAFSIWSMIYLGLAAFSIYQLLPANRERFGGLRTLIIASCLLNCTWIYCWHHDLVGLCVFIILGLAVVLLVIVSMLRVAASTVETVLFKGTFGIYAGWVTVAAIVNFFVYLRSAGSAQADSLPLAIAAVAVAVSAAVFVTWRFTNHFYPLAVAWALTAIAISQSGKTALVVACAGGVIMCLLLATSFILSYPSTARPSAENE